MSKVFVRTHATLHLIKGGDLRLVAAWTVRLLFPVAFPLREFADGCHQCAALAARCPTISAPEIRRKRVRSVSMLATISFLFCAVHHLS